ncbi:MAG: NAD-dependent epimerase/dehydratase family protein, partial [Pseudomonadota bacterium]
MRIIVIGASGDIGSVVCEELGRRHDLIRVGRTGGEIQADISDPTEVELMYEAVGSVDAVVCTAGDVHFAAL